MTIRKSTLLTLAIMAMWIGGLIGAPLAYAQSADSLTATADRTQLTTDDTLTLTLTLHTSSGSMPNLTLPDLDGFRVAGRSFSTQLSMINGVAGSNAVYVYRLQPTQAGTFTIPELTLDWQGQHLTTDPIVITVTPGTGAPGASAPTQNPQSATAPHGNTAHRKGNRDFFIEAEVDKQSAYVGEPIQYTLRMYNAGLMLGQPDYQAPKLAGFWHPQKPEVKQYTATTSDGTTYNVTELTMLLFPTMAGQVMIDPATISVPGGFFSDDLQVQSDPIAIDVKPLPAGAPIDFNGAVGQFAMTARPDRTSTRVGEPVTLRVELSGLGNWGTLGDPNWPGDAQWRIFNNKMQSQSDVVNGQLTGVRVYEQLYTPLAEGKLTLPAIRYSYFDPATKQYQTATTDALTIDVAPGNPNLAASLPKDTAATKTDNQAAEKTLALKPAPHTLTSEAKPLTQQPLFSLLFIVPIGLVAGELAIGARKHYLKANAARLRRSRALKRAQRQLKHARRSRNIHVETGRIVLTYLEDQIQTPLTGAPHSTLAQVLRTHKVSSALTARVIAALFVGEASEYSQEKPQTNDDVVKVTGRLLEDLEKELTA